MFILTALKWAWALAAPWLGRVLLRLLPWLAPIGPALKSWLPVLVGVGLTAAFALLWWMARPVERLTVAEAVQVCEEARVRAELEATKAALETAQATLRLRSIAIEMAEREIEQLRKEREALRAAAPDPNAPVFDADDPWLRAGRSR